MTRRWLWCSCFGMWVYGMFLAALAHLHDALVLFCYSTANTRRRVSMLNFNHEVTFDNPTEMTSE